MHITLLGAVAILLFAIHGHSQGFYKTAASFASLFLAALFAKPFSPLLVGLLSRSHIVPQALIPLSGLLLAGLLLFLVINFCAGRVLRNREAAREHSAQPRMARWERFGGSVLGAAWGFFLVSFVLVGFHLIGNVEEVLEHPSQPVPGKKKDLVTVSPERAITAPAPVATAPVAITQTPAEGRFLKLKHQIEGSAFGYVVRRTDPAGDRITGVFRDLKTVVSNPDLYREFTHHPVIARFSKNPKVLALSNDMQIRAQLQNGQYYELLDNTRIASLLKDDALVSELKNIDIGKILQEVIEKAPKK